MTTFSNPRTEALIEDWPFGRQTCKARFEVETDKRGMQRVARYTENKTRTGWNKPKRTTYAKQWKIVDGDDGKTYLVEFSNTYGARITVTPGTMKFTHESVSIDGDEADRFRELIRLFLVFAKPRARGI